MQKARHATSLNVNDPEAHRLAQAIAKRASTHIKRPYLDHAEFLYDEQGLPK